MESGNKWEALAGSYVSCCLVQMFSCWPLKIPTVNIFSRPKSRGIPSYIVLGRNFLEEMGKFFNFRFKEREWRLWNNSTRRVCSSETPVKPQCLNWFCKRFHKASLLGMNLLTYTFNYGHIWHVLSLCEDDWSKQLCVSELVSGWGTWWLFLGWKHCCHPELMILKTKIIRPEVSKVF